MVELTLWQKIQAKIKDIEAEASTDLSRLEAAIKAMFETHASVPAPAVVAAPTPVAAVAVVLDTTPVAPPKP